MSLWQKRAGVATLGSEPIRAQYLDGAGPIRVQPLCLLDSLGRLRRPLRIVVVRDLEELALVQLFVAVINTVALVVTPNVSLSTTAGLRHNFRGAIKDILKVQKSFHKKSGL